MKFDLHMTISAYFVYEANRFSGDFYHNEFAGNFPKEDATESLKILQNTKILVAPTIQWRS